jgi:hypothetical protein
MTSVLQMLSQKVTNPLRPLPRDPSFMASLKQEEVILTS